MLGQFLEYSVAARPLAASFEFFESLGFKSIPVSDTLPDPYLVCFDGAVAVGLHDRAQAGPRLTFVRPGLRDYVRPLRRLGVELTHEHLRDNEFNSVGFTDPGGQEAVLVEARTFPPGGWDAHNVADLRRALRSDFAGDRPRRVEPILAGARPRVVASGEAPHRWQRLSGPRADAGLARDTLLPA